MHLFFVDDKGRRQIAPGPFNLGDDYEFRVPGLLETRFLVRGMRSIVDKYYTSNIYNADFSDPRELRNQPARGNGSPQRPFLLFKENRVMAARSGLTTSNSKDAGS